MPYTGRTLIRISRDGTDWTKSLPFRPLRYLGNSDNIAALLARPTWSVRSLLPPSSERTKSQPDPKSSRSTKPTGNGASSTPTSAADEVTPRILHHLLRLSALSLPRSPAEETRMLSDLRSQIHFVRRLQSVPTEGVEPLVAIRDETSAAKQEATIGVADVQAWLDLEEKVGRNGTIRRRKTAVDVAIKEAQEQGDTRETLVWEANEGREGAEWEEGEGVFRWTKLEASGTEEGRRWNGYYVVRRGKGRALGMEDGGG